MNDRGHTLSLTDEVNFKKASDDEVKSNKEDKFLGDQLKSNNCPYESFTPLMVSNL